MKTTVTLALKDYIQPFERALAISEIQSLAKDQPMAAGNNAVRISVNGSASTLVDRLAYTESLEANEILITEQVRREASIAQAQSRTSTALNQEVRIPKRRCLRYGAHGIHEYRGKFFPQLARSLANIAGTQPGDKVLDPMCGSGTTCVEVLELGLTAIGLDTNPLSVLISEAKCESLRLKPGELSRTLSNLTKSLSRASAVESDLVDAFDDHDLQYLLRWYHKPILLDLLAIRREVERLRRPRQKFFLVALSNILRRLSLQKEDDLRVRKELTKRFDEDAFSTFIAEASRSVGSVEAYLRARGDLTQGDARITIGDARKVGHIANKEIAAVITSPPYATALPYIDTDRLSLCFLGLESRAGHRAIETKMIGNREITRAQRDEHWADYCESRDSLPPTITDLIDRIDFLNSNSQAGFRRKNLSALLGKYFIDMTQVIREIKRVLANGAPCYMVVGDNHTIAGGQRIDIPTAKLLADTARNLGASDVAAHPMEMLTSRDIFRKNASATESIVEMRF